MKGIGAAASDWLREACHGWDRFWFEPRLPHTLALIRILAGGMLFYTHLVWGLELNAFLGADGWLPTELSRAMHRDGYAFSYLWWIDSAVVLWIAHLLALAVFAMLTVGFLTRTMSVLAWVITLSYCHRLTGAFFGLDQVNAMLAMYLMLGPAGAVYSVDDWLSRRRRRDAVRKPSTGANLAIRLMQVHLCVIYLFGGLSKMRGRMWWDGSAVWYAVANHEYQSLDITWLGEYPLLIAFLTHVTLLWETSYCVLVWPRRTRALTLTLALAVHGGIAAFLGMITFGTAMLIANLSFVPDHVIRGLVDRWFARFAPPAGSVAGSATGRSRAGGRRAPLIRQHDGP